MGSGPGPQPRGKLRGISGGAYYQGVPAPRGDPRGVPAPGGVPALGGCLLPGGGGNTPPPADGYCEEPCGSFPVYGVIFFIMAFCGATGEVAGTVLLLR